MVGRFGAGVAIAVSGLVAAAGPAGACGGLVGENGTIQLVRTATLAAYHDGVERYVTSFEFTGEGAEVGSIVPLPDIPTAVERGGDWTLQRLAARSRAPAAGAIRRRRRGRRPAGEAEVLLETKIDALDITILGAAATRSASGRSSNGFFLTPGRARGARLLRRAQPDLHGGPVRRVAVPRSSARRAATARRSC